MKLVAAFFILSGFLIVENSALLCFTCYNHPPSYCNAMKAELGPRPMLATTNCPQTPDYEYERGARAHCYKTVKEVQTDYNLTYKYDRGCTIAGGIKDFCTEEFQKDPETKCFLCKGDWCNHGHNPEVLKLLIAVLIFVNIVYFNNYIGFINLW